MPDKLTEGNLARHDKETKKSPKVVGDSRSKAMTQFATVGEWSKDVKRDHVKGDAHSKR